MCNEKLFLIKTIQIKNKEKWWPLYVDEEGQMYNEMQEKEANGTIF